MAIKKQFLKSKPECKVTFKLSKNEIGNVDKVSLLGSFTNWEANAIEMNKLKTGDFTAVITLPSNSSYEFRYLADGNAWFNDPEADAYQLNGLGAQNCVVSTTI